MVEKNDTSPVWSTYVLNCRLWSSAPFNLSLIHKMDYQYMLQGNKSETMYEKFVDWFRLLTFHTLFNKNWVSQFYWRRKSGKTADLLQVSHGNNVSSTYKLIVQTGYIIWCQTGNTQKVGKGHFYIVCHFNMLLRIWVSSLIQDPLNPYIITVSQYIPILSMLYIK